MQEHEMGIRDIRVGPGDQVVAEELELPAAGCRKLQRHIMLFCTGVARSANSILAEQTANIKVIHDQLDLLRNLADRLRCGEVYAVDEAMRRSMTMCDAAAKRSYPRPRLLPASDTSS
jgi:galactokinase/mevalonate kinase-like predicted kinase